MIDEEGLLQAIGDKETALVRSLAVAVILLVASIVIDDEYHIYSYTVGGIIIGILVNTYLRYKQLRKLVNEIHKTEKFNDEQIGYAAVITRIVHSFKHFKKFIRLGE